MRRGRRTILTGWIFAFGLLANVCVYAGDNPLKIAGFASAGMITGDLDADLLMGSDIVSKSSRFGTDNTLGIHITAEMNEYVSFTGQLLAKGLIEAYSLEAHWAFIDFHPRHNLSIRGGRLVLPVQMGSEYVDVAYAYPWVRPPIEIYSGIPFTSYSGVDLLYTVKIGDSRLILQPFAGSVPPTESVGLSVDVESGFGVNASLQFEYGMVKVNVAQIENVIISSENIAAGIDLNLIAFGADLEMGKFVFITEYMKKAFDLSGLITYSDVNGDAWFLTLGYRMGNILPHITYSSAGSDVTQIILLGVQFPTAPLVYKQHSITLGVRYDILPRTALKIEFQQIHPQDESWGLFRQEPKEKVKLLSLVIDVTF